MSQADDLIQRLDRLAAERSVWDDHWQEIAERVLPRQADFNTRNTAGDKRTDKIFDSTACALPARRWRRTTRQSAGWSR